MMTLTFGSLFTGVGGFDLGFERAGMVCKWQVENDKHCQKVLETYSPDIPKFGDVRDVGKQNLKPVGLICGGFPCQDLSVGWNGKGLDGERSGLWFEFYRIITELKPRWVIIENVPGLLSSNGGRDFAIILQGLAEGGYLSAWRVLDAQYFGLAQQRERVFIVSSLGNGDCARVLFEEEPDRYDTQNTRHTRPAPIYAYKKRGGFGWSESEEIALTLESQSGTHTGGNDTIPLLFTGDLPRWATPVECERLQGFPDGHTNSVSKTYRYRQMGNAAPVPIIEWIGYRIMKIEMEMTL
jgi:DNA (cytosine-5)-methyltransferase 1